MINVNTSENGTKQEEHYPKVDLTKDNMVDVWFSESSRYKIFVPLKSRATCLDELFRMCAISTDTSIPLFQKDLEDVLDNTRYVCFKCDKGNIIYDAARRIEELVKMAKSSAIIFFDGKISLEEVSSILSDVNEHGTELRIAYNHCSHYFMVDTLISVWYL